MAYTTINDPSIYFNTVLWTGNNTNNRSITGVGFQPDLTWIKQRQTQVSDHCLFDSTRGSNKKLCSNSNAAQVSPTLYGGVGSFGSDGFTLVNGTTEVVSTYMFEVNKTSETYVAWNWKCNGGTTSTNTDGTITTTTQSNATAGFSIATWTGNGTNGATIGHGNGGIPNGYIVKRLDTTASWGVGGGYTGNIWVGGTSDVLNLNSDGAVTEVNNYWGSSVPNNNILPLSADGEVNASGGSYIGYFFRSIQGYSKLGRYRGNGSSNGTFIYTGFKPAFIMMKRTDSADSWVIVDAARDPINKDTNSMARLRANLFNVEATNQPIDFFSNGFKYKSTYTGYNTAGATYLYMAFAENPFVTSTGVPTTAR